MAILKDQTSSSHVGVDAAAAISMLLEICLEIPPAIITNQRILEPILATASLASESSDNAAKDSAMFLVARLCEALYLFPHAPPISVDLLSSTAVEPNQCATGMFVRNGSIFALANGPAEGNMTQNRDVTNVVVRDCTAKYCWHITRPTNIPNATGAPHHVSSGTISSVATPSTLSLAPPHTRQRSNAQSRDQEIADESASTCPTLEEAADPGTIGWEDSFEVVEGSDSGVRDRKVLGGVLKVMQLQPQWWQLNEVHPFVLQVAKHEETVAKYLEESRSSETQAAPPEALSQKPPVSSGRTPLDYPDFTAARAVCGHVMGLCRPDKISNLREVPFSPEAGRQVYDSLARNLKLFDGARSRECHKIGVIYVPPHHEDQFSMLRVECGSDSYRSFIEGLGWQVPLSYHNGFNGKLDRNQSTGTHAPYFADAIREILFHVTTQMPTDPQDAQQVNKKRHVGNDQVQVVYSEHDRDYRPETISTQFNDAHIIVYPIDANRQRIQTLSKKDVVFGPLCDGMVVHRSLVAQLSRRTAANADTLIRYAHYGHKKPFLTRRHMLNELIQKTSTPVTAASITYRIFDVDAAPAQELK